MSAKSPGTGPSTQISDVIDAAPLTSGLARIVLLCGLAAMIDGFDVQAMSFVAPVLVRSWQVPPSAFAIIFSAGLVGLMVGQFAFTPLADRIGRKAMILSGMVMFGAVSIATAAAKDMDTLVWLRFIGGIGLGGVTPNLIALTSEYSPKRIRAAAITLMFGGFSLGAVAGGFLSSVVIPAYGWPTLFIIGGVAPILLAAVLAIALPESIRFMVLRRPNQLQVQRALDRFWPQRPRSPDEEFTLDEPAPGGLSVSQLFAPGRAAMTATVWAIFFVSLLLTYVLLSWLPTILSSNGVPIPVAQRMGAVLSLGGVAGGVFLGFLIDRLKPIAVLAGAYLLAGVSILLLGFAGRGDLALTVTAFAAGFFTIGGQTALNAVAVSLYPTSIRATGLGYAMGFGRLGSIVGPLVGGALIASHWGPEALFAVSAAPAAAACLLLAGLAAIRARSGASAAPHYA